MSTASVPPQYQDPEIAARIALIAESFERLLRRPLVPHGEDMVAALWEAPCAIVAHGTEDDPVFFFGNRAALDAFDYDVAGFVALPSRLSAEAEVRDDRQRLLDRVMHEGFIDDYAGLRISATGKRFPIENAVVWNLIDLHGVRQGQAATFTV